MSFSIGLIQITSITYVEFCEQDFLHGVVKRHIIVDCVTSARGRALKCTSNLSFVLTIVHVHFGSCSPYGIRENVSEKMR